MKMKTKPQVGQCYFCGESGAPAYNSYDPLHRQPIKFLHQDGFCFEEIQRRIAYFADEYDDPTDLVAEMGMDDGTGELH